MSESKQIQYTEAAKKRLDDLNNQLRAEIESMLRERKYVPGDQTIEVTGSDVDELARSVRLSIPGREYKRYFRTGLLVRMYLAIGVLTTIAGIFYPYLSDLTANPTQLALLGVGLAMTIVSYALSVMVRQRDALREINELEHRRQLELQLQKRFRDSAD